MFGDLRVVLIDFDLCGKAGETRYPSDIMLLGRICWHKGVGRGRLIAKEHDEHLHRVPIVLLMMMCPSRSRAGAEMFHSPIAIMNANATKTTALLSTSFPC